MDTAPKADRFEFKWIEGPGTDLFWYVLSPLIGLLYLPLIFFGHRWLNDGAGDPLYQLEIAGGTYPMTVAFLVVSSWALFLDGPHFWPTIARTFLDREEWRVRGDVLRRSLLLFLLGPAMILTPLVLVRVASASGIAVPPGLGFIGPAAVITLFLGWAYFHVVRQHWGFFRLYKAKAHDHDPRWERLDTWFFHLAMFLPPVLFLTSPHYPTDSELYPNFGLREPVFGGFSIGGLLHGPIWVIYGVTLLVYAGSLIVRHRRGERLNGPKLLLLAAIVPVHLVAFIHPALPLFSQVLVGVGHSFQYQRIVWRYGRRKYGGDDEAGRGFAALAFKNVLVYGGLGVVFTFLLLRGPWVEWIMQRGGAALHTVLGGLVVGGETVDPDTVSRLGIALVGGFFLGWLFQHYYLDARIWRISRDRDVRRNLDV